MNEKKNKELKEYMLGLEIKDVSKIQKFIIYLFHVIILLSGITLGFIFGMYYKDISLSKKTESVINYKYINQIETALTDKNELVIIDKKTNTIFVYSDTCATQWWKMITEKQNIKAKSQEIKK